MELQKRALRSRARRLLAPVVAMGTVAAGLFGVHVAPAHATVSQSYACAYRANVNIFNTGYKTQGCAPQTDPAATANSLAPSVTLPASGGYLTASDPDGAKAIFSGVATMFSSPYDPNDNLHNSGKLDVVAAGGAGGVQVIARAETVGPSPFWTRSPSSAAPWALPASNAAQYPYDGTTGYVESKCQASSGGQELGTVTIKNAFVDTATGSNGYPTRTVAVPNPTPVNYRVDYTLDNVGDRGYIIFNEQIPNPDGTLTVTGAHMYMQGSNAYGDIAIAKTVCGLA